MSLMFQKFGFHALKGTVIFREGEPADGLYMIHKGKVAICKASGVADELINVLEEPEFFGEMALISSEPRSATARAEEDCELIHMDRASFENTIRENPGFALSVVRILTRRLREADELIAPLIERERKERVLADLMRTILERGRRDRSGRWLLFSHSTYLYELMQRHPMDRVVAERVLYSLRDSGSISIKKDGSGQLWLAMASLSN